MIRLLLTAFVALLPGTMAAHAALPPTAQRQVELKAIIDSPEVQAKLEGRVITAIRSSGSDAYTVHAGTCRLPVRIVDQPRDEAAPMVGPRKFRVEVGALACRR